MTNYEKETIIRFNEEEKIVYIYTYNGTMKRKLASFAAAYPDLCRMTERDKTGAEFWEVDKSRLSVNFKRPLTEEERAKRADAYKMRFGI